MAFQCVTSALWSSICTWPIISLKGRAIAELGHDLANLLGDKEEEVDDVLGLAGEAFRSTGTPAVADADRTRVEMTLAHHDAAGGDQRRGGETEFVGPEQRADHDVAAGAEAAVDLYGDAAERSFSRTSVWWVSASPISHGEPACLIEVSGEAPVPPSKPAMVT